MKSSQITGDIGEATRQALVSKLSFDSLCNVKEILVGLVGLDVELNSNLPDLSSSG